MMPTRRRTRDQNRATYIRRERELNALQRRDAQAAAEHAMAEREAEQRAHQQDPLPTYLDTTSGPPPDYGDDPPPF